VVRVTGLCCLAVSSPSPCTGDACGGLRRDFCRGVYGATGGSWQTKMFLHRGEPRQSQADILF
jgi:hypothetical protein